MVLFTLLALVAALSSSVFAAPSLEPRQSITTLSSSQVSAFKPYAWYASAAYCSASELVNWSCGARCNANSGFKPIAAGGDGDDVQYWFVGYDPSLKSIIVGHQGTDPSELAADLEDADFFLESLSSSLFPGLSSSIEVHNGFAGAQASTATSVLAAVQSGMSKYGTKSVTLVGHSLGAAISSIDAVYLRLHLPSSTTFKVVLFGLPRVGNQAWANYVDEYLTSSGGGVTHVNNMEDIVPILPGRFLGFHHFSGEVHIQDSGAYDACPGQDNTSDLCIVGDVPNIFDGSTSYHDGPYAGVTINSSC